MKHRERIPYILLCVFAASQLLLLFSKTSENLARQMDRTLCVWVRTVLSAITSIFPFSLFELIAILSPLLLILTVVYIIRAKSKVRQRFFAIISALSLLPALYVFTLGISYNRDVVTFDVGSFEATDYISAAKLLSKRISDYDEAEINSRSLTEYTAIFSETYPEICHGYGLDMINLPKPKPLITSSFMSRMGTLAFYSYPTAEININTKIPEYMKPFTVAHEYAHLLGAGGEAEANFLAFLATEASDNQYTNYSGALSALEYLLSDIRKNDAKMYIIIYNSLSERAKRDLETSADFFAKHTNSLLYRVADGLNSAHLEVSDSHGADSYSVFSRYVAHYLNSA